MDERLPHRRVAPPVALLRALVRRARLAKVRLLNRGRTRIAPGTAIGPDSRIYVPASFEIAPNVAIGGEFLSQTDVRIGEHCLLSTRVSFVGNDHDVMGSESAFLSGRMPASTVVLEGDNFIGFGATICGDVVIGRGAVVGAGALVVHSVPANAVVGGVPARVIGRRRPD